MAQITRSNGDVLSGVNQNANAGNFISFNGARLSAFKIIITNSSDTAQDVRTEGQAGEVIDRIVTLIMTRATPTYMQIEDDTSGQVSMLIEGDGGWTASSLQTEIRGMGTSVGLNNVDVSRTVVTNNGLKLA
jgi:hypothetical protein